MNFSFVGRKLVFIFVSFGTFELDFVLLFFPYHNYCFTHERKSSKLFGEVISFVKLSN